MPNGSCTPGLSSGQCATAGGVYQGDGSACTGQCSQPAACCKFAGSCLANVTSAACTGQGGAFQGSGSACGSCPAAPPVIYTNCNISTGPTTLSGVAAPAGGTWSECSRDETDPTVANTVTGFSVTGSFRIADDFAVG